MNEIFWDYSWYSTTPRGVEYTECKYGGPLGRRPGRVMKVRLVRPRCFVLTMLPLKVLLRGRASLFYFAMPTSFCVLEC